MLWVTQPCVARSPRSEQRKNRASSRLEKASDKREPNRLFNKSLRLNHESDLKSSQTNSTFGRWSFGSRPFGYDYLGYPDPYFLFPYSIDPWERGSFRAPDLHDDPFFYDRVPPQTQRSPRQDKAPLQLKRSEATGDNYIPKAPKNAFEKKAITTPKSETYLSSFVVNQSQELREAIPETKTKDHPTLPPIKQRTEIIESLTNASSKFAENLLGYPGGDQWVQYLKPNMLPIMATQGKHQELNELLTRYDITFVRSEIRMVSRIGGFAESRNQLRKLLQSTK